MILGEQPVNTPDVLQTLKSARALIADEANWCQGDFFISGKCCAVGALAKASASDGLFDAAQMELAKELERTRLDKYNDTHTHAEVLNLFDCAIAKLGGEQQQMKQQINPFVYGVCGQCGLIIGGFGYVPNNMICLCAQEDDLEGEA